MFGVFTIVLLTSYHLLDNYEDYKNNLVQTKLQHSSQYQKLFLKFLQEQYVSLGLSLITLLNNQEFIKLFAERKREELYNAAQDYYDLIQKDFFVEHIHFYLAPATSFLRMHLPQMYGDDVSNSRPMVIETNRSLKPQKGLDMGLAGLRLRLVYPVFYQHQHVGALEMGKTPLYLAHYLKQVFKIEYAVGITQEVFDKAQQFKSEKSEKTDIKIGNKIFYTFSSPMASKFISQYQENQTDYNFEQQLHTTYKIPLYDFANQYLGDLLLIENIDPIQKIMWDKFIWYLTVSIMIAILMIALLSWFITNSIHTPLQHIVNMAEKISLGYLNQEFKDEQRNDEIGRLTMAMHNMNLKLRSNLSQLQEIIQQINIMSSQLKQTAEQIAQSNSHQTQSLENINQLMMQLTDSVGHNAENAKYTFNRAKDAVSLAKQGDTAIVNTTQVMEKVVSYINVVKEIAHQTRLLALNATIEAARAGEHGLGFEVVANEVHILSNRAHETVLKISDLAHNSQQVSDFAKKMFNKILPDAQETKTLVEKINVTCHEQHENINKINKMVLKLEDIAYQNLAASEELAGASLEMNTQAQQLFNLMNHFIL